MPPLKTNTLRNCLNQTLRDPDSRFAGRPPAEGRAKSQQAVTRFEAIYVGLGARVKPSSVSTDGGVQRIH